MSVKSWHDSDDVDSDVECEAYNMLYYELSKKNEPTINTCIFENLTAVVQPDSVIELTSKDEECVVITSDSDDSFIPKKITCSNKVSDLYVGSNSSDSEYEEISKNMENSADSSFILNINSNFKPKVPINIPLKNDFKVSDWSIDMNYTQPRSIGRSRYFDESRSSVCELCRKKGHSQSDCAKKGPVCILCGKEGHISNECDDIICHVCFQTDHLAKKCPFISKFLKNGCRRCGQRGHSEKICPDIWRQYKYTISGGVPVKQTCSSQSKYDVFCANCSRLGHFTDQCQRDRMSSRFIGPAPIMEIVQFDLSDIYSDFGLSYVNKPLRKSANLFTDATETVDSMIADMDVTGYINDLDSSLESSSNDNTHFEPNDRGLDFGDGTIMLSPIVKNLNTKKRATVLCSTPALKRNQPESLATVNVTVNITSQQPRVPTGLLKKLFPAETEGIDLLSTGVRTKLRRSLENILRNGYVQNGCKMTQDQKNDWLKEISMCQKLSNKDRRILMENVSATLNNSTKNVISNTEINGNNIVKRNVTIEENVVIGNTLAEIEPDCEPERDFDVVTDVPESRRKRNKAMRQRKSLQNELKVLKKDNNKTITIDLTNELAEYTPKTKRRAANTRRSKSAKKAKNDRTVMVCD